MTVVKIPGLIILRIGRLDRKNSRLRVFAYFYVAQSRTLRTTKISSVLKTGQNMWLMFLLMTYILYQQGATGQFRWKHWKKHSALRTNSKSLMVSFVRIGHLDHLPSCDKKIYIYVNPKLGAKNCKWWECGKAHFHPEISGNFALLYKIFLFSFIFDTRFEQKLQQLVSGIWLVVNT